MNNLTEIKIFRVAEETFISQGYSGTTLDNIATSADVNKASIHYYFRSKENIYWLVLRKCLIFLWGALNNKTVNQTQMFNSQVYQDSNIHLIHIIWFIVNEIKSNNLLIHRFLENDSLIKKLFYDLFRDSQNIEVIKKGISFQFTEIVNYELKKNLEAPGLVPNQKL